MKRAIFAFLVITIVISSRGELVESAFAKYSGGSGVPEDPYQIANVADLMSMANDTGDYTKCFILTADLDLDPCLPGNQVFTRAIIAPDTSDYYFYYDGVSFKGVFDGNGHTISNMTIDSQGSFRCYIGLFGYVDSDSAEIKNLGLINPDVNQSLNTSYISGSLIGQLIRGTITNCYVEGGLVRGYEEVGGLIGNGNTNDDTYVENCYTDCNVYGTADVGGLIGGNSCQVTGCHAHGSVSGRISTGGLIGSDGMGIITNSYATGMVIGRNDGGNPMDTGGLIGETYETTVTDCNATGSVTGIQWVGGLIGDSTSSYVIRCYATGNVTGTTHVGGLTGGQGYFEIIQCFATGDVNGNDYVGGLVGGSSSVQITRSFASGKISGINYVGGLIGSQDQDGSSAESYSLGTVSGTSKVGGLVGENSGEISNSFASGNVSGSNYVGGLVGYQDNDGVVGASYSVGVISGSSNVGGLVGYDESEMINRSFWDINTSGQATSSGGTGKTTVEMKTKSTFTWNFGRVWLINEGVSYPQLRWSVPDGWYGGGSGEPNNPYRIIDAATLMALGYTTADYNKCFILTADIDLDPNLPGNRIFGRVVISDYYQSIFSQLPHFTGVFDGNGHTIRNLTIDNDDAGGDYLGFFGGISQGQVKNLRLENVSVTGRNDCSYIAGLAAYNDNSDINNCSLSGIITGGSNSRYVGGLVAYNNYGGITNCNSACTISGGDYVFYLGGMIGYNYHGTVTGCHSSGTVSANYDLENSGGLVGNNEQGNIYYCFSSSILFGGEENTGIVGGLVGYNDNGNIDNCFTSGAVNGRYASYSLGGLVGTNDNGGQINNCYSTGNVTTEGGSDAIGGLAGGNYFESGIRNCYSTSAITVGEETYDTGGLLGYYDSGDVNGSYFLDSAGPNNGYGIPLTDAQMKQQASFVGWDFSTVWRMRCEQMNYPKLKWQAIPIADFSCPDGVDFVDYSFFANRWLNTNCAAADDCDGTDFDTSGTVDIADLKLFCDSWLQGL